MATFPTEEGHLFLEKIGTSEPRKEESWSAGLSQSRFQPLESVTTVSSRSATGNFSYSFFLLFPEELPQDPSNKLSFPLFKLDFCHNPKHRKFNYSKCLWIYSIWKKKVHLFLIYSRKPFTFEIVLYIMLDFFFLPSMQISYRYWVTVNCLSHQKNEFTLYAWTMNAGNLL